MKAFFKHFGSKGRISAKLPPPKYNLIVEPFAGSAAYSVRYATPNHYVLLFDTDERVCAMWHFLMCASEADILSLPVEPLLLGADIRDLGIAQHESDFIQRWLTPSGSRSNFRMPPSVIRASTKHRNSFWGEHTRARIASQVQHLKRWQIRCSSYTSAPDVEAHWHIDPPYRANSHGKREYKTAGLDYASVAEWCKSRRGDVTVHEQNGADWLPFELFLEMTTSAVMKGGASKCKEMVWTNQTNHTYYQPDLFEVKKP